MSPYITIRDRRNKMVLFYTIFLSCTLQAALRMNFTFIKRKDSNIIAIPYLFSQFPRDSDDPEIRSNADKSFVKSNSWTV
jgi:hypothetical protein